MSIEFKKQAFIAKPLLADRFVYQQVSPFARALDIAVLECGGGRAISRMGANSRNARSAQDARIDLRAILGLIDHSVSYALAGLIGIDSGISTFDLRVDFSELDLVEGDILAETTTELLGSQSASIRSTVIDASGKTVATGAALFRIGSFPGGGEPDLAQMGSYNPELRPGPLANTLGLVEAAGEISLAVKNPAAIGWETTNALHGGAIAALLMSACQNRVNSSDESAKWLATLTVQFIRPGQAGRLLRASSCLQRRGRAASYISANCFHEEGKNIATAQAIFVETAADE